MKNYIFTIIAILALGSSLQAKDNKSFDTEVELASYLGYDIQTNGKWVQLTPVNDGKVEIIKVVPFKKVSNFSKVINLEKLQLLKS